MSLSPLLPDEERDQTINFATYPLAELRPTLFIDNRLVQITKEGELRKALQCYAVSRGLAFSRCSCRCEISLEENVLYVCEAGAFEYKNNKLRLHYVWLACSLSMMDSTHIIYPNSTESIHGPPHLYIEPLVKAHTPFVHYEELASLFMNGGPVCGYAVDATTYAVAKYTHSHLFCIICGEKFDSLQTWASHYTVKVLTVPLRSFEASQRLDLNPVTIPLFGGDARPFADVDPEKTHTAFCDRDDIMVGDTCGFHVKDNVYAIATYHSGGLGCIDPRCKHLLFKTVREWASHVNLTPTPLRRFVRGFRMGERIALTPTFPHPHKSHTTRSLADRPNKNIILEYFEKSRIRAARRS